MNNNYLFTFLLNINLLNLNISHAKESIFCWDFVNENNFCYQSDKNKTELVKYEERIQKLKSCLKKEEISPYIHKGTSKYAFVLVHGFLGTPNNMESIATEIKRQGHSIIAPLLPGHGTNHVELDRVSYKKWIDEVELAYLAASELAKNVIFVGHSMGGGLSSLVASKYKAKFVGADNIKGLFLFDPFFDFHKDIAFESN